MMRNRTRRAVRDLKRNQAECALLPEQIPQAMGKPWVEPELQEKALSKVYLKMRPLLDEAEAFYVEYQLNIRSGCPCCSNDPVEIGYELDLIRAGLLEDFVTPDNPILD